MGFVPKDYIGSICEVRGQGDCLLTTGMIEEFTDKFIKIGKTSHKVSNTMKGMLVKINIINSVMGQRYLSGSILVAPVTFMLVTALEMMQAPERRAFFRIPVQMQTCADTENGRHKIVVEDFSLGGLAFVSQERFAVGEQLQVHVLLPKETVTFCCKVRRCNSHVGHTFKHGCEFIDNNERKQDVLCSYIFKLELQLRRKGG